MSIASKWTTLAPREANNERIIEERVRYYVYYRTQIEKRRYPGEHGVTIVPGRLRLRNPQTREHMKLIRSNRAKYFRWWADRFGILKQNWLFTLFNIKLIRKKKKREWAWTNYDYERRRSTTKKFHSISSLAACSSAVQPAATGSAFLPYFLPAWNLQQCCQVTYMKCPLKFIFPHDQPTTKNQVQGCGS